MRPRVKSYGESSTATLSPARMRIKFLRILPETCARTWCLFSSSTRNMALGNGSMTVAMTSMASSLGFPESPLSPFFLSSNCFAIYSCRLSGRASRQERRDARTAKAGLTSCQATAHHAAPLQTEGEKTTGPASARGLSLEERSPLHRPASEAGPYNYHEGPVTSFGRVKIQGPLAVTATVCSKCAEGLQSAVSAVHSSRIRTSGRPAFTIG